MRRLRQTALDAYDRFLFESCSPGTCVVLRIVFGIAMLVYAAVWWADGTIWFSDQGVMQAETARRITGYLQWSPLMAVPATPTLVQACLTLMVGNALLLMLGVFSRWQAAMLFFWMVCFQHRNPLILDGEDTVFRLFAFYLAWMPLDCRWSLWRKFRGDAAPSWMHVRSRAWPLRLIQMQMCFLYLSAAWSKWLGETWRDGSALFYVFQMGDLFGRGWWPDAVLESDVLIRAGTWSVLAVEAALPVLLILRRTRAAGVILGIGLHLLMEYSMDLFLFQWVMVIGLLAFVDFDRWVFPTPRREPEDSDAHADPEESDRTAGQVSGGDDARHRSIAAVRIR